MKTQMSILLLIFPALALSVTAQEKTEPTPAAQLLRQLQAQPENARELAQQLHRVLSRRESYDPDLLENARPLLRENAPVGSATLSAPDEPGEPLEISGLVKDVNGKPLPAALMHVFQTDAEGYYTPADKQTGRMNEPQSRLFGYVRTDDGGRYKLTTIRPGGYPFKRSDTTDENLRLIPEHIHFVVTADGYYKRAFQLVFKDDPRMNQAWLEWARRNQFPVANVRQDDNGKQHATCDIILSN